jgi:hypothetical protein
MRPFICAGQEFHNAGNGIARKEGKIDAGIPSLGDVVKHPGGPVLVVTDREEYFGAKQPFPLRNSPDSFVRGLKPAGKPFQKSAYGRSKPTS